jgi:hypothetical protein
MGLVRALQEADVPVLCPRQYLGRALAQPLRQSRIDGVVHLMLSQIVHVGCAWGLQIMHMWLQKCQAGYGSVCNGSIPASSKPDQDHHAPQGHLQESHSHKTNMLSTQHHNIPATSKNKTLIMTCEQRICHARRHNAWAALGLMCLKPTCRSISRHGHNAINPMSSLEKTFKEQDAVMFDGFAHSNLQCYNTFPDIFALRKRLSRTNMQLTRVSLDALGAVGVRVAWESKLAGMAARPGGTLSYILRTLRLASYEYATKRSVPATRASKQVGPTERLNRIPAHVITGFRPTLI